MIGALPHLTDAVAALRRLAGLVRPGGTQAVVGFCRTQHRDWPWAAAAFVTRGIANWARGQWEHTAPIAWPPPDTLAQLRATARDTLPGARIRRLLLGRYLMTWQAPGPHERPATSRTVRPRRNHDRQPARPTSTHRHVRRHSRDTPGP